MSATERVPGTPDPSVLTPEEASLQRKLKFIVAGLGALIVLGLLVVFARVIYLASKGPSASRGGTVSEPAVLTPDTRLDLPAGAVVRGMSLSGGRLAVQFDAPSGAGIAIVDLESGKTLTRLRITPEPPRN